nr:D-alanyl-D-alanine carboxypeptidase family protein [Clostridia bacterium]
MQDRFRQRIALPFCLFLALFIGMGFAFAEDEAAFVSPTRNPNAPEYNEKKPEDLQAEQLVADAFVLMEAESGDILFERNADKLMYPASTTKIMTALLALQFCDLNEEVNVNESAVDLPADASVVPFKKGEIVTMQDAIYGMMLRSGNDAANAIAEHIAGSQQAFVDLMNSAAQMIGMTNTHYVNPHGYHDPEHYTTARDMALLTREALQYEAFRKIVGTQQYALSGTGANPSRMITNSNLLLDPNSTHYYYPYAIGVKTGFHSQSGYTLVAAA